MKKLSLIIILLFMTGCVVTTTYQTPDGLTYVVKSKSDALVTVKTESHEITVDNRGRPSAFELILPALLNKSPDVHVGD